MFLTKNMVMPKVNVFEVKAKFSEYLDRATRGERIVICRHNKPVAELRPIVESRTEPRPIGPLPGRPTFEVPPSFFESLPPDELELWDGVAPTDPLSGSPPEQAPRHATVAEEKAKYPTRATRKPARRSS